MIGLDGITMRWAVEVSCPLHGGPILRAPSIEEALVVQRQHFEWSHQPDPSNRLCLWRRRTRSGAPERFCGLPAAHGGLHDDGDVRFGEVGSLPRVDCKD